MIDKVFSKLNNNLDGKTGTVEYYYQSPVIKSQEQLDNIINYPYTLFNKTSGNLVYKIWININVSGLTLPGGNHLVMGYIYGDTNNYNGAQLALVRKSGIKFRSCEASAWTEWA